METNELLCHLFQGRDRHAPVREARPGCRFRGIRLKVKWESHVSLKLTVSFCVSHSELCICVSIKMPCTPVSTLTHAVSLSLSAESIRVLRSFASLTPVPSSPSSIPSWLQHRHASIFIADELHWEDLAGDELMVHGIDYTSVSPCCRMPL